MTTPKLTPWFVNGEKPARPGVYNVSCQRSGQSGDWWSYWDGHRFLSIDNKKETAQDFGEDMWNTRKTQGAGCAVLVKGSWRGLADKPE